MKIVIDIPEELYEAYKGRPPMLGDEGMDMIAQAIANGTPIKNGIPYEERPIGHWKDHRWCSNCGCGIPTDVYGGGITEEEAHFCVECGADMRGKENE